MNNTEQLKRDFVEWLKENRERLPINAFCWNIQLTEEVAPPDFQIESGKYKAALEQITPFYKPYSKMEIF